MKIIIRILVGLTFIISGILKMISIYDFELYMFSFGVFSFDFYSLLARIVIGVEMALGIGYILNIYNKFFYRSILYVLISFTLFLIYLSIIGRDENCRCFGELISLDPTMSIVKNILLMALLIYTKDANKYKIHINKKIIVVICSLVTVIPLFVVPPDKVWSLFYSSTTINKDKFDAFVESNKDVMLKSSVKMLCFYSTSCDYCKLSSRKISRIVDNNNLDQNKILNLFFGDESSIPLFYEDTDATVVNYEMVDVMEFISITNGNIPVIILFEEDGSYHVFDYKAIDDDVIVDALR